MKTDILKIQIIRKQTMKIYAGLSICANLQPLYRQLNCGDAEKSALGSFIVIADSTLYY